MFSSKVCLTELGMSITCKVKVHDALAFAVSLAVTFILNVPIVSGVPEKVFVAGLNVNQVGRCI